MQAGANLPAVGGYNQTVILDAVRRSADGVSRVELAEQTGLSPQTVSNVTRRLLDEGLIVDAGTVVVGVGKPRTILRLEPTGRYALGIHLDPTVVTVVLLDLASRVVADRTIPMPASGDAPAAIAEVIETAQQLLRESRVDRTRVMGAGVAAPGPIDLTAGALLEPPLLRGWKDVAIRDALAAGLGMPVLVEKDVTAAIVAERWAGTIEGRGNVAFFYFGTGVGAGLVLHGNVIRGASGNAGDIGNLMVGDEGTGTVRTLGAAVLPRYIVDRAVAAGVLPAYDGEPGTEEVRGRFAALAEAATRGEEPAAGLLDAAASDIATGLVQLINMLDIDRVIFGGPFLAAAGGFLMERVPDRVRESRYRIAPHPIEFEVSEFGDDVAAIGAACLVLDHAFSPRPEGLLIAR